MTFFSFLHKVPFNDITGLNIILFYKEKNVLNTKKKIIFILVKFKNYYEVRSCKIKSLLDEKRNASQ